jgi:hypothetical protein
VHPPRQLGDLRAQRLAQSRRKAGGAFDNRASQVFQRPQLLGRETGSMAVFVSIFADLFADLAAELGARGNKVKAQ